MKKIILFLILLRALSLPVTVDAKRLLPQVAAANRPAVRSAPISKSKGVSAKVSFGSDHKALNITFSNLIVSKKVDYALTYKSNGRKEAVIGVVNPSEGDGAERELLFGTCSSGVCTYHTRITEAKLIITTTLSNGRKVLKPYRLKV
ncbi:hypothetical protein COW99_04005 [Candidatus Roizmanbacteria bacterium CG22_combo_CG10-13_8_21_14_all_38_20]|uniref:SbsA Ig-like domain-containing protein n=1 Tax=Candidatus Roizmanbacteria bacterium CG22_combo_CG10-13_8_21_14_all_38_20 TaxID=1974862 RepID=A0A2H0BWS8_9BACT|nr:hypothetical protein [Candidatus Microgenomates bacterium]PIP61438.1 MAG: hypothetical protein COW99_04005 [Candidatus Roizmanbacteria bacterium CG22_combo_CG10-13_8_21_14_all_38_20]PJC32354.1 MAG: hypothetical protein CO050_00315 [Candidatus Roizmanbacteria bacterium CG_4_9_14_0_2_um_filter_38_17]